LVRGAIDAAIPVVPVPGPSAVVAALSISGLPTDSFLFVGFVPRKATRREQLLENVKYHPATLVFYESPRRMSGLIASLVEVLGDREAVMARELTKVYEEVLRGPLTTILENIAARDSVRGECTLLVAGYEAPGVTEHEVIKKHLIAVRSENAYASVSDLVKTVAKRYDIPRKAVYDEALRLHRDGKI
jgi:16S rRNA (cytidine1402-2'-O)-methyltransferase